MDKCIFYSRSFRFTTHSSVVHFHSRSSFLSCAGLDTDEHPRLHTETFPDFVLIPYFTRVWMNLHFLDFHHRHAKQIECGWNYTSFKLGRIHTYSTVGIFIFSFVLKLNSMLFDFGIVCFCMNIGPAGFCFHYPHFAQLRLKSAAWIVWPLHCRTDCHMQSPRYSFYNPCLKCSFEQKLDFRNGVLQTPLEYG